MTAEVDSRFTTRDPTLDLARVACVLLVVVAHLMLTGVGHTADRSLVIERTAEAQPWFDAASWIGHIMPLFFVIGGFAAMAGWRRLQRRGGDPDAFVRARLARLARPALPLFAFLAVALAAVWAVGADPRLVDAAAIGVGSPLWFLAAYALAQALAPTMIRLHERAPLATLAGLALAAAAVDAARLLSRIELVGLLNVLVVWVAVQQLGFWMHDGWFRSRSPWTLGLIIVAGFGAMYLAVPAVGYSWSMLSNQYPPTVLMLVLGLVQAAALTLLHPPLTAVMRTRGARTIVGYAGGRLVTIYLWHVPVIAMVTALQLLLPTPMPEPGSGAWWLTRIPMLLLVLAIVWLLSLRLVRYERPWHVADPVHPGTPVTATAVVLFALAPFLMMAFGLDTALAAVGVVGTALALWLLRGRRARIVG